MDDLQLTQLRLEISAQDATTEEIDRMTRQLLSELSRLDIESSELMKDGHAPSGTKSVDPVTIGSIAIAVLPAALPKVVEAIQAWALRGSKRSVKFKGKVGNQAIEFEGSAEDLQKILRQLAEGKKRR